MYNTSTRVHTRGKLREYVRTYVCVCMHEPVAYSVVPCVGGFHVRIYVSFLIYHPVFPSLFSFPRYLRYVHTYLLSWLSATLSLSLFNSYTKSPLLIRTNTRNISKVYLRKKYTRYVHGSFVYYLRLEPSTCMCTRTCHEELRVLIKRKVPYLETYFRLS